MKKWVVIILLSLAQFVMVLDSTVMNVSISALVKDLNTTVNGVQAAITFYTLTMAALMLLGGKLGEKWGSRRALVIGSIIYGAGSFLTGISQNLPTLLFGWSLVEGIGAILVIPAIASLIVANYNGKDRALAYGILGAVAGAGAAVGPLIGGIATTYFSWRYVFIAETAIILIILLFIKNIKPDKPKADTSIDVLSAVLSATGMALIVFGILQSKTWGWIQPKVVPMINGMEVAPLGFSIVIYLLVAGLALLWWFFRRQQQLATTKSGPFLDLSIFNVNSFRAGTNTIMLQYFITAGAFFVLPVYLQLLLGLDALDTGLRMMPLSIALVLFAVIGAKLVNRFSIKFIINGGFVAIAGGLALMLLVMDVSAKNPMFLVAMFIIGTGLGLLSSQVGNVILSSAPAKNASQAGGLQGTFQNLGSSLGTAIVGSVLLASLTVTFDTSITQSELPSQTQVAIAEKTSQGVPIISMDQLQQGLSEQNVSEEYAEVIFSSYQDAQLHSLKTSILFLILALLIAIPLTRNIPNSLAEISGGQKG